ncbi:hypothetical protein PIB30_069193 [Stylosanthes scabra]|uniref:Uncharacterized protein n=1 Tax=Stylosanthes scabra TaxID=79078 RepID=A0ABU6YLX3_9FABA|nr:hypothetical protein [Stylosanthes scabra]
MPTGNDSKEVLLIPNQNFGISKRISGDCEFHNKEEEGFQYGVVKFFLERWDKVREQALLGLEDWRLMRVTKVKSDGKLVLGYSMARKKSRVSIELGVQRLKDFQNLPLESIRQGFEPTPRLNFHERPKIESIRLNREPRNLEGPERLTTRLTAIADHRE